MSYSSKTIVASAFLAVSILAGCGDFEWFPKSGPFTNYSATGTKPGTVMRELAFPAVVKWVSDVVYVKSNNSFWLLAWTSGAPPNAPNALVQINATTGDYINKVDAVSWPYTILDGSTLAFDETSFWITSNGSNSGVVASEVYQIVSNGMYFGAKFDCPATGSGFCRGLAFDGATSSYWTAGSDNAKLVNYQLANGTVSSAVPYTNSLFASVSDVAFDSVTGEVFVVRNGIIRVSKSSGAVLGSISFALPGSGRGDWDGKYFWGVDNSTKSIKALFVR